MRRKLPKRVTAPLAGLTAAALIGGLGYAWPRPAPAAAQPVSHRSASLKTPGWSQSWGAAMQRPIAGGEDEGPNWSVEGFGDHSLRQVVRLSAGGTKVRIRLSNRYGTRPLRVAAAAVARSAGGAQAWPGTTAALTFGGTRSATVAPGADIVSDPAPLTTAPLEKLAVTLRFTGATGPATFHRFTTQPAYRAPGDHLSDVGAGAYTASTDALYYLTGIDVTGGTGTGTVVAFGDSLIDGVGAGPGADARLPDALAERLAAARSPLGVVNAGIGGNRLRYDSACAGDKATARFARDVLDRPGVRAVIVHLGANDIRDTPGDPCLRPGGPATAAQVIDAQRQLVRAARARGLKVVGTTILPMKGALFPVWSPEVEKNRDAVNHWIRTSGTYDAVLDADRIMADPADADRPRLSYVYQDGLHPNDAGYQALARGIDLRTLR
ncbi:lysophospholipase L1-like esterase [Actinomadura coerulea]|uniref:Lysophospholipase L1-like esterase n=1 Tax=Actinomadura coerulea TaxID=46159 RepID=A0A7X0G4A6_9ACTN|nr:SGNH/GDSL hydrolase family protein [Actinomadura coerulea]MBB6399178.1 lysophospholipase L1-like esterase [Actinomadura coerulea]GGQ23963.1 SGNH hydrolase [Actinomadura coerulea]